jgi:hypothetical protein
VKRVILVFFLALLCIHPASAGKEYSCNMAAFSAEDLEHYKALSQTLLASVQETKELKNGFAFKLPADALVSTSEWVSYERHCCPFFDFEIEVPRDSGPLSLHITGDKGVKEFIRTEFEL